MPRARADFQSRTPSSKDDPETPPWIFGPLDLEFRLTLDACAVAATAKCAQYFTPADDGLAQSWAGHRVWLNPPYVDVELWIAKAVREVLELCELVVVLVPARIGSGWWHDVVFHSGVCDQVRLLTPRVQFIHPAYDETTGGNNAASSILALKRDAGPQPRFSEWRWKEGAR